MRSKAHIGGHPLHPILISFPIAFFTGAFISDLVSVTGNHPVFFEMGGYLLIAGLISGAIAAVPGFIDFIFTVPPDSSASKRAAKHALLNVTMMLLFVAALLLRDQNLFLAAVLTELAGIVLMCIAGWHGGTLVHRNQIGVDIRYAGAGKWKETQVPGKTSSIVAGRSDELGINQMKLVKHNNQRIVLGRTENGYVAFSDHCSHRGGSLAAGAMMCNTVQCPWHGSQFDVLTGEVKAGPAREKIKVYPVSELDGEVHVNISH